MNQTVFTRREKHVLIIAAITIVIIVASSVDQETLNQYEYLWLLLYVLPLGLYIATDSDRKSNS